MNTLQEFSLAIAEFQTLTEDTSEFARVFDKLKKGDTVLMGAKAIMGLSSLFDGTPNPWIVGRRSSSKRDGRVSFTLLQPGQTKASKYPRMNRVALYKRGDRVMAAVGDMAIILKSLELAR